MGRARVGVVARQTGGWVGGWACGSTYYAVDESRWESGVGGGFSPANFSAGDAAAARETLLGGGGGGGSCRC